MCKMPAFGDIVDEVMIEENTDNNLPDLSEVFSSAERNLMRTGLGGTIEVAMEE